MKKFISNQGLLIAILIMVFIGCNEDSIKENSDKVLPEKNIIQPNLPQVHIKDLEFQPIEFGLNLNNMNLSNFPKFSNLDQTKNDLIQLLPESDLKIWIASNKDKIGNNDWFNIQPIGKLKIEKIQLLIVASYEKFSQDGEEYIDYWCLTSLDGKAISKVTNLGYSGIYPKTESGSEKGSEYLIKTIEQENLKLELHKPDSIVSIHQNFTIRTGYDWRVDQNLKINDSTAAPVITQVFSVL